MCSPGHKGHDDLTSSPPSSELSPAVLIESSTLLVSNYQQGLRSLRDLTQHLTTRADDNHAPPVSVCASTHCISTALTGCQDLVRFFALRRIKPHAPLLVRAPVNSFETRVSNPVCSPHFRASASVTVQSLAFATGVPPNLYAFHRYTGNSNDLSCTQARQYPKQFPP